MTLDQALRWAHRFSALVGTLTAIGALWQFVPRMVHMLTPPKDTDGRRHVR